MIDKTEIYYSGQYLIELHEESALSYWSIYGEWSNNYNDAMIVSKEEGDELMQSSCNVMQFGVIVILYELYLNPSEVEKFIFIIGEMKKI